MVSFQVFALTLATGVLAQQQNSQPYYMRQASQAMVNYAMKYKHEGVPNSVASSQAGYAVDQIMKQPQATALVEGAMKHVGTNGPQVDGSQLLSLANQASQLYEQNSNKPEYKNYAQYIRSAAKNFNTPKAAADAEFALEKYGSGGKAKYPKQANKVIGNANIALSSVKQDPQGKQAVATGKVLGQKLASDFGTSMPSGIKQKVKGLFAAI